MNKSHWKEGARAVFQILLIPLAVCYFAERYLLGRERSFPGYSQLLSLIPGLVGNYARLAFYHYTLNACAPSACISFGVLFSTPDVKIGERVYIGPFCVIGHARIGDDVIIASRVSIISGLRQHDIRDIDRPIRDQTGTFEVIQIQRDCWIGEGAIVAANVGKHSVISAGSVVFSEVPPRSIMRGNPATLLRNRVAPTG